MPTKREIEFKKKWDALPDSEKRRKLLDGKAEISDKVYDLANSHFGYAARVWVDGMLISVGPVCDTEEEAQRHLDEFRDRQRELLAAATANQTPEDA